MDQWAKREAVIRRIPRQSGGQLGASDVAGIVVVAVIGLTGVLGTLVTAWWLALS